MLSFQNFEIEFFREKVEGRVVVYGISVACDLSSVCSGIVIIKRVGVFLEMGVVLRPVVTTKESPHNL